MTAIERYSIKKSEISENPFPKLKILLKKLFRFFVSVLEKNFAFLYNEITESYEIS